MLMIEAHLQLGEWASRVFEHLRADTMKDRKCDCVSPSV
jgi:hypothetical protein